MLELRIKDKDLKEMGGERHLATRLMAIIPQLNEPRFELPHHQEHSRTWDLDEGHNYSLSFHGQDEDGLRIYRLGYHYGFRKELLDALKIVIVAAFMGLVEVSEPNGGGE